MVVGVLFVGGVFACSSPALDDSEASLERDCKPNQTLVCTCGLDKGVQTCTKDKDVTPCDCSDKGKKKAEDVERELKSGSGSSDDFEDEKRTETTTTPTPTPAPTPAPTTPKPPTAGPSCSALAVCCAALRPNFWGSANQCDTTVAANVEYTCQIAHADFRRQEDNYDPPAGCLL